ncbi:MAG: MurR/RpiR family transcriptional regulator [Phycisphaerae bacterium]|nr:MurR/RpiR family transcriptional regulator [Phycisphaerae bacterium]
MSITNLIASHNERFTPTDRRIAEAVLEDPMLLTFGTVSAVAERVSTSSPSIVRFATKLGFDGFSELQQSVREEISKQFTSPSHRARQQDESVAPVQLTIEDAVHAAFDALTPECIKAMALPIVVAKNVWILSGETSMAGAIALASGLSMIRPNVRLVQEHSASRDLCGALAEDVAVVFDFSRYRRNSVIAARTLADLDVPIVAITDGPLSPLSSLTEYRCELDVPAVGPFDSSVPAVIAAELLVSQVVTELGDEALNRIDRLEVFWQATDTFLVTSPPTKP